MKKGINNMRLENKIAIVTGAGSGIGSAIARLFAKEGSTVILADIDQEGGTRISDEINTSQGKALFINTDVSLLKDLENLVAIVIERYRHIDILCNNAGFGVSGTVITTAEKEFDKIMLINVKGLFFLSKYVLNHMLLRKKGSIVNIASVAGIVGLKERAAYCTSKGAVVALTRAMALDHVRDGIRINCICPGTIDTPWVQKRLAESNDPITTKQQLIDRQPMGRLGLPDEIAHAALYLASDDASFVTGSALIIDGGLTAG